MNADMDQVKRFEVVSLLARVLQRNIEPVQFISAAYKSRDLLILQFHHGPDGSNKRIGQIVLLDTNGCLGQWDAP